MSNSTSFDDALALQQNGRIAEAEAIYRRVLQQQPDHPGAWHLLGVARQQQGDYAALEFIGRAISINPQKAVYHNNCGAAMQSLGRHAEAAESFQRALTICPNYADALSNLGMAETALGHDEAALASLRRALDLQPRHVDALALVRRAALCGQLDEDVALRLARVDRHELRGELRGEKEAGSGARVHMTKLLARLGEVARISPVQSSASVALPRRCPRAAMPTRSRNGGRGVRLAICAFSWLL